MGDKPKHDTGILMLLIGFVVILISAVFWMALSDQISSGVRWIRLSQLYIASFFTDRYDEIIKQLFEMTPDQIEPIHMLIMTQAVGEFYRIPLAVIMGFMAVHAFMIKSKHPYARRFNLETMAKEQSMAFPVTTPITKFNPLNEPMRAPGSPVPDKLPPFAEALSPEEWVAYSDIPVTDGVIDRDATRLAFARQLGGRWKDVNALPMYAKALFAVFSMKANGLRSESDDFLGELAMCWEPGKGLLLTAKLRNEINSKISDPHFGRKTEKLAALHAFVTPAMLHCLQEARDQGGVLAPAQFLWLRAVDRNLWYALNNLGRGATHVEGAGSIAHYRAEKSSGKPIPNPQVDTAIEGLTGYLQENYIKKFPAKEYGKSKK